MKTVWVRVLRVTIAILVMILFLCLVQVLINRRFPLPSRGEDDPGPGAEPAKKEVSSALRVCAGGRFRTSIGGA